MLCQLVELGHQPLHCEAAFLGHVKLSVEQFPHVA